MSPVLKVTNLTKRYEEKLAVDHVSFEVRQGEIVGLLGPNGAGKTTTIHMLLSVLEPTEGTIELFGKDLTLHREEVLEKMNFAAPYALLPYNLSVEENLRVFSLWYGVNDARRKAAKLMEDFKLSSFRNTRTGALSSGEQTRLALAKAFLNDPKLLLLDEPTASLDPAVAREFRSIIYYKMQELNGAILWTSHNMREVETMCNRVIFLIRGKIIADDTPEKLKRQFQKEDLEEIFVSLAKESEQAERIPV